MSVKERGNTKWKDKYLAACLCKGTCQKAADRSRDNIQSPGRNKARAAHAATKITVGRSRWWGLHKFGVPIKMISLSLCACIRHMKDQLQSKMKVNESRVIFTNPRTLKEESVDVSRLIRVFVNNLEDLKRSVK